ncbi:MAG: cytochrome c [Betaproteobacteria bacterium]|jgi:mono/diheme cytochrome c family protein
MPTRTRLSVLLAACLGVAPAGAQTPDYWSRDQADRGERLYAGHCAVCHGARLEGASATALSGATFDARWPGSGLTVDDLLYIVQTQMPWGDPGRLTRNQYLDIVAHLLAANGYPGGPAGLPTDAASLAGRRLAR